MHVSRGSLLEQRRPTSAVYPDRRDGSQAHATVAGEFQSGQRRECNCAARRLERCGLRVRRNGQRRGGFVQPRSCHSQCVHQLLDDYRTAPHRWRATAFRKPHACGHRSLVDRHGPQPLVANLPATAELSVVADAPQFRYTDVTMRAHNISITPGWWNWQTHRT